MEIIAISETPNHNTMKVSLSEPRQDNSSTTYTAAQEGQPEFINRLFEIEGVKSIFYVLDLYQLIKKITLTGMNYYHKLKTRSLKAINFLYSTIRNNY